MPKLRIFTICIFLKNFALKLVNCTRTATDLMLYDIYQNR